MSMPRMTYPLRPARLLHPEGMLLVAAIGVLGLAIWRNAELATYGYADGAQSSPAVATELVAASSPAAASLPHLDPFASRAVKPVQAAQARPAPTRLNVTIEGIVHVPQRGGGVIMLRNGAETRVLRPGDEVGRGASIVEIARDQVIVDNNGQRETLSIERPKGAAGATNGQEWDYSRYVQARTNARDDH